MRVASPSCCALDGSGRCTPSRRARRRCGRCSTARKLVQGKRLDIESGIRGVLRGFGLKVGAVSKGRFEARVLELIAGHSMLETVIGSMLKARAGGAARGRRVSAGAGLHCRPPAPSILSDWVSRRLAARTRPSSVGLICRR